MSNCPNCGKNIDSVSLCFSAFPVYFKCSSCNIRLKLIDSKPFWLIFFLCLAVTLLLIIYIPLFREYGLGVITGVFGWSVASNKVLPYLLRKDNLAINE